MSHYFRDGEPDWRRLEQMARRGWGRFTREMGDEAFNWGDRLRVGRMMAAGDLRLAALYLIEQQSRHGYDLIKAIEEKSNGFYSPSPGIVYPALTFLEEAGYATSRTEGNKKLYTITDEGRAHLADNREAIERTLEFLARAGEQMNRLREFARRDWSAGDDEGPGPRRQGPRFDQDLDDVLPEVNNARRELKVAINKARKGSEAQQRRLAEIMRKAAADIRAIVDEDGDVDI